jgi:hypothetical protein
LVRAPIDRRHGGLHDEINWGLHLGLQELRRGRAVRLRGPGLRQSGNDEQHLAGQGRSGRKRGCTWNSHQAFQNALKGIDSDFLLILGTRD